MPHLKKKNYINLLTGLIFITLYSLLITPAFAAPGGPATFADLEKYIIGFLGTFTTLVTVVVFVMLLFGGFKYLVAGGDPKAIEGARNTITYAIIGLVVMIAAWIVLRFIQQFTGVNVTIFSIKITP